MAFDPYGEFDEEETLRHSELKAYRDKVRTGTTQKDVLNEVGEVDELSPEDLEKRQFYTENYVDMHQDLFPRSTGIKPFGPSQIESIRRTWHVVTYGGKSVIAEPRGFGKTSRTANNCLMSVLQGKIKYALLLASTVEKATDIIDSIKTELVDNEELYKLYPKVCACFDHVLENPLRSRSQTYMGDLTNISLSKQLIRFQS